MTIEQARELVKNPLYLGCMIIKTEGADGQISGALSTTGDTLRPALQIIKCAPGVTCVSGAMLMLTHEHQYGDDGIIVMGDVAVTPVPTADQLAQIAVCTAQTARSVAGIQDPRVAIDSHHVVAHCVAQLDVANGVVTNLQNGIFAGCDGLAAHRVAQEQALVLVHLCEHLFHTVEGFEWGDHRLFVGFHHHLQATESHGAVHIQNTVFGGVGGGAAHASFRSGGWGGDDVHCALENLGCKQY